MIDEHDRQFINNVMIAFADELGGNLRGYSEFIERMQLQQNDRIDEVIESLNYIGDKLRCLCDLLEERP